ncbi:hypothetical protein TKK_0015423 [Trichogramma kaykai]
MSAGLLDLQALSKSSEPLENTLMSTWLRSSRPSSPSMVVQPPSAADITKRIVEAPAMAKDAPVPSLKEFSPSDQDEKLARLEGLIPLQRSTECSEVLSSKQAGVAASTPSSTRKKRPAMSPPEVAAEAKRATGPHPHEHEQVVDPNNASAKEETFTVVKGRHGRRRADHQAVVAERGSQPPGPRRRKVRVRPDTIVVKATGTTSYADILRRLYAVLALQIGDLDECATKEEICTALCHQLGMANPVPDAVRSLRKAYAGTQTAVIDLPDELAAKALKLGHLRVGWVSCRVRQRAEASRCFRSWEFDHVTARCVGPDRSKLCYQCGQDGHRAKTCRSAPVCLPCQSPDASGHATISPSCPLAKKHLSSRR